MYLLSLLTHLRGMRAPGLRCHLSSWGLFTLSSASWENPLPAPPLLGTMSSLLIPPFSPP